MVNIWTTTVNSCTKKNLPELFLELIFPLVIKIQFLCS